MYHRIKHKIKTSKAVQYTLLLLLIVVIAAIPYPIPHTIKEKTIAQTQSMKECLATMGLPMTFSECTSKLGLEEEKVREGAEEILAYSINSEQKMSAAIITEKYAEAELNYNNLTDIEKKQARKDIVFARMSARDYGRAAEACEGIIKEDANDSFCLDVLGITYYVLNKNKESFEYGKKAYSLYPHPCRYLNLGLEYGNTGNITEAKRILDDMIKTNKNIVLSCWSPIKTGIPLSDIDRYNLCFLNDDKSKSICRAFAREGWIEGNVTKKKTADEIKQEEEQKKLMEELNKNRVL